MKIYTAMIDESLDENGYIVPGVGDVGDRSFGTTDYSFSATPAMSSTPRDEGK